MNRSFWCALVVVALTGSAQADKYDDFHRGSEASIHGNNDDAIFYMTRALDAGDLPPAFVAVAHDDRAAAYEAKGELDLAIADYTADIKVNPNNSYEILHRAFLEYQTHKLDDAIADFSAEIRLRPKLVKSYVVRGIALMQQGKLDQALTDLNSAVTFSPNDSNIIGARGDIYRFEGRLDEALADYNVALGFSSENFNAAYGRGLIREDYDQFDDAASDCQEAAKLRPDWGDPHFCLGRIQWNLDHDTESISEFEQALRLSSNSPYRAIWLELAREKSGKNAIQELQHEKTQIDSGAWPTAVIDLYLGNGTPKDVFQAADAGQSGDLHRQHCEADFYVAEWELWHKNVTSAKPMLEDATKSCPPNLYELPAARAELKRQSA